MKSLQYNKLEDYIKAVNSTDSTTETIITKRILEIGLELGDINNIFDNYEIDAGEHLASNGKDLYTYSIVAESIRDDSLQGDYKSLYNILKCSVLNKHTKINKKDDLDILYRSYHSQWKEVYGYLYKLISNGASDKEINNFIDNSNIPFLTRNINEIPVYRSLYEAISMGVSKTIVNTIYNNSKIRHIYVSLDTNTGVPYLYINKYTSSDNGVDDYRKLLIPLEPLKYLMSINKPIEVEITDDDKIASGNVGKISGFLVGSKPDREIFSKLNIEQLYQYPIEEKSNTKAKVVTKKPKNNVHQYKFSEWSDFMAKTVQGGLNE